MRDIREDLLQRSFGIVSRYFDAMAQFDERLQKLHEGHSKLIADINCEKGAVDAMLAIESSRPACDIKTAERDALQKVLADQILPTIEAIKKKVDAIAAEPKPLSLSGMLRVRSKGGEGSAREVDIEKPAETPEGRGRDAEAQTTTVLRNLSEIVRQYPWEKMSLDQQ